MIRVLLILSLLHSSEDQYFEVEFLGIPTADISFNISDIIYNKKNSKLITVETNSKNLSKYIFNIDNYYKTITSENLQTILSFDKKTYQPNVINHITTSIINDTVYYDESSISIPHNYFNIFSLLYFLSQNKIINITSVNIEREGILYTGQITPINSFNDNKILYDLQLIKKVSLEKTPVIKNTDIFTWALFREDSKREILVDYNNNNIVECTFKYGKIKMTAQNSKYFK